MEGLSAGGKRKGPGRGSPGLLTCRGSEEAGRLQAGHLLHGSRRCPCRQGSMFDQLAGCLHLHSHTVLSGGQSQCLTLACVFHIVCGTWLVVDEAELELMMT